jgi:DNA-binding NarL/FixJ family response regulator
MKITVYEDNKGRTDALKLLFQDYPEIEVLGFFANCENVIYETRTLLPDLILMDINMPILDGIEATRQIKAKLPQIKVIMLTSHDAGDEVYASLAAGADAYCLKDIKLERLIQVIEMVNEGALWLDPAIAQMVVKALPLNLPERLKTPSSSNRNHYNLELTERESEVLGKIVEGKSNKEIADALFITIHTVKAHVANIISKLAVDDRTQAAVKALRDGLVKK